MHLSIDLIISSTHIDHCLPQGMLRQEYEQNQAVEFERSTQVNPHHSAHCNTKKQSPQSNKPFRSVLPLTALCPFMYPLTYLLTYPLTLLLTFFRDCPGPPPPPPHTHTHCSGGKGP